MLSSFACDPRNTRGRRFLEEESPFRSSFQRDRDRIIHSTAFRRLKHKTQVFVEHEGDHYRTRLTHSIEVAQVARTIASVLGLNPDLTEAVALAHDLGHPPFGHTGEEVLNACLAGFGGFDHNAQTIRVVTRLERHYPEFDGLNLTWECLEGIAKHNGPVASPLPWALAEYTNEHDLALHSRASAEAQVAALSDDIAYNTHDLDDGLRANLFEEADLLNLPIIGDSFRQVKQQYPHLDTDRRRHAALRGFFDALVRSAIAETRSRLDALAPGDANVVRNAGFAAAMFPEAMRNDLDTVRTFLYGHMYRHPTVQKVRDRAAEILEALFHAYRNDARWLPEGWLEIEDTDGSEAQARAISDYVAGMTDRFALQEHARIRGQNPALDGALRL